MRRILTIAAICAMGIVIPASCQNMSSDVPQPKGITSADVDSVSYVMGFAYGRQISEGNFGALNLDQFCKGVKDASAKKDAVDEQTFYRVLNGFMDKKNTIMMQENQAEGEKFLAENKGKEGVVTTESGLQYQIVRAGNGVKPTSPRDTVVVDYEGTLLDGTEFDSSYKRGEPAKFPLNGVIPGWTEGIQYLDEGGEMILWIPSDLAYGPQGAGGVIGPHKTLKFKVELHSVIPAPAEEEAPATQK